MKNITITVDEKTAAWVRNQAAQLNISLSRYVRELLEHAMRQSREYGPSMRQFLSKRPSKLKRRTERYTKRDELND